MLTSVLASLVSPDLGARKEIIRPAGVVALPSFRASAGLVSSLGCGPWGLQSWEQSANRFVHQAGAEGLSNHLSHGYFGFSVCKGDDVVKMKDTFMQSY